MPEEGVARPRVLVVDDEHVIADSLAIILSLNGFDTWTSYGGEDAIETARSVQPHAILSDVVMRGISGVQMAMRILDEQPNCEVILFSGQALTHNLVREAEARGYYFTVVPKPVPPVKILTMLRERFPEESR